MAAMTDFQTKSIDEYSAVEGLAAVNDAVVSAVASAILLEHFETALKPQTIQLIDAAIAHLAVGCAAVLKPLFDGKMEWHLWSEAFSYLTIPKHAFVVMCL